MNDSIASAANTANAVMGIYGISGSGKSSLADTGAEEAYETFGAITLCYAADLGGFGNKRLTLIRHGIMRVWDPRNHVNPFETMELMSLGAFPERLIDPERGYADPNVRLIRPHRSAWAMFCPQGHLAHQFEDQRLLQVSQVKCPTCGVATGVANASKVEARTLRHPMFAGVGLRIYDSMTSLNDWGMQDLQDQSARGVLPSGLLGAADSLVSGQFRFGSSSEGQYGFLQNRTYGWLANIKTIPDQVMPAIATFHVEMSKEAKGKAGGGDLCYGPKIAGNARTAAIGGWLGHCLHMSTEPWSLEDQTLVYRAWMKNHIDPRDPRKIPYVAKHRGTPLGIPDYLEDKPGAEPWSGCSLRVFYRLQREQLAALEAEAKSKYPDAPGMWTGAAGEEGAGQMTAVVEPIAAPVEAASPTSPLPRGRRRVGAPVGAAPTVVSSPSATPSPTAPENAGTISSASSVEEVTPVIAGGDVRPAGTPAPVVDVDAGASNGDQEKSVVQQQLEASLAERAAGAAAVVMPTQETASSAVPVIATAAVAPAASAPPPIVHSATAPRVRRVARPPV